MEKGLQSYLSGAAVSIVAKMGKNWREKAGKT